MTLTYTIIINAETPIVFKTKSLKKAYAFYDKAIAQGKKVEFFFATAKDGYCGNMLEGM